MGPGKCPRSIRCVIAECYVPHFTYVCNLLFLLDSPWRRRRCTKITIKIGLKIGDRLLEEWITFTHESRVFISIITWCATEEGGKREAVGSIVGCWVGGQWWAKPMECKCHFTWLLMENKKKRKEKAKRFDAGTARIHCYIGLPIKSLANAVAMLFNQLDRKRMEEIDREKWWGKDTHGRTRPEVSSISVEFIEQIQKDFKSFSSFSNLWAKNRSRRNIFCHHHHHISHHNK